jgi:hypothetical protein
MPERSTATLGRRALVAMEVAIAFAVSWNPFVKSNPSAVTTTRARITEVSVTPRSSLPDRPALQARTTAVLIFDRR